MAQRQQMIVFLRLACMIACLLTVFALYRGTIWIPVSPPLLSLSHGGSNTTTMISVFQTVYSQCILIIVSLVYYCIAKLCFIPTRTKRRRRPVLSPPQEFVITDLSSRYFPTTAHRHLVHSPTRHERRQWDHGGSTLTDARLTIRNVWVLVYGLGFVFFITSYCFLALQPVCLTFIGLAIAVLSLDELLTPQRELTNGYTAVRFLAFCAAVLSLVLVSVPLLDSVVAWYVESVDIYSIIFGLVFPFCSQFILLVIRDHRRYTLGTVVEVCEFGFPFTAFLALFHLCVAYGQRYQSDSDALSAYRLSGSPGHGDQGVLNLTDTMASYLNFENLYRFNDTMVRNAVSTDGPSLLFYALTPLIMIPAVVCYMACALDGCAIDPLLSLVFVLDIQHLWIASPPSAFIIASVTVCSIGIVVRVMSEYNPSFTQNPLFTLQTDSTQLPHSVAWSRSDTERAPTMKECEMETRELASDSSIDRPPMC